MFISVYNLCSLKSINKYYKGNNFRSPKALEFMVKFYKTNWRLRLHRPKCVLFIKKIWQCDVEMIYDFYLFIDLNEKKNQSHCTLMIMNNQNAINISSYQNWWNKQFRILVKFVLARSTSDIYIEFSSMK